MLQVNKRFFEKLGSLQNVAKTLCFLFLSNHCFFRYYSEVDLCKILAGSKTIRPFESSLSCDKIAEFLLVSFGRHCEGSKCTLPKSVGLSGGPSDGYHLQTTLEDLKKIKAFCVNVFKCPYMPSLASHCLAI